MKLSDLIIDAFIQKFSETENFCGFTLPFIFLNGAPAVVHAHKGTKGNILLSDYGLNLEHFISSIGNSNFKAEDKLKEFILLYDNLKFEGGAITSDVQPENLDFALLDFGDVIKCMVDFRYKTPKPSHLDDILAAIKKVLEQKYDHLTENPKVGGRSGEKYKFDFGSDNLLIDFSESNKDKTNRLLRKYIDTRNLNNELEFSVIINDLESDKYKSEQSILSDYAHIEKLSSFIPAGSFIH